MHNENRFQDTFRGHNTRPNSVSNSFVFFKGCQALLDLLALLDESFTRHLITHSCLYCTRYTPVASGRFCIQLIQ